MTRQVYYRYMGTNGIIESPVHLEGIYFVRLIQLTADKNKVLTNGTVRTSVIRVPEEEEGNWEEVNA